MPTITNPGVIQAIVSAYLSNGMDKGQAALAIGYAPSTIRSANHTKLWDRPDVKAELRKQQLDLIKKTGYSKEQATQDLMDDRQLARECKQPSAAISANTALIRLYGMDQMACSDATVIVINPPKQISSPKSVESRVLDADGDKMGKALESKNDDS